MAKRKRDVPVLFWVSAEELELIHQKMQQYGTENLSAYLRKMALDGYVVKHRRPCAFGNNSLGVCLSVPDNMSRIRSVAKE